MSRSALREVVTNSVTTAGFNPADRQVAPVVDQVVADLDTLADSVLDTIRRNARDFGATDAQIDRVFAAASVNHDPEPEVEAPAQGAEVDQVAALQARLDALEARLNNALASAQRQGYRL